MTSFLRVEQASRRFAGLLAVDSVSFAMNRGEILSLIGPNGAGKTTLFNLISGQLKPTTGAIILREDLINNLPPHARAQRGIGRTFQIAKPLIGLTARENVMVGAFLRHPHRNDARAHALSVLELVGLKDRQDLRARSLGTPGRKRLEIARVLATGPRLMLLDEALAGLTPAELQQAIALVKRIHETGVTLVIVEHIMEVIMTLTRRVIVFHQGHVIAKGTPTDVVKDEAVIEAYLGRGHRHWRK